MSNVIFGYTRVSMDREVQTMARQIQALQAYAKENNFRFDKIWEERISGAVNTANRPVYAEMFRKLGKGDTLVLTDLDRLGRDADNVIVELKRLKEYGVKVIALDTPYLNDWNRNLDNSLNDMVIDIVVTLKAHIAQQEREKIAERVKQGLAAAKDRYEKGLNKENGEKQGKIGRPPAEESVEYATFAEKYEKYLNGDYGKTSKTDFARIVGVGRTTLYKYIDIYDKQKGTYNKPSTMEVLQKLYVKVPEPEITKEEQEELQNIMDIDIFKDLY